MDGFRGSLTFDQEASRHPDVVISSQVLNIFAAVEQLHNFSAKEMNKLLRDSHNLFSLRLKPGRGSSMRVDVERLVLALPLHLLACLASGGAELRLRYLLRGVRLLHSLTDLALRHQKLEQLMLQEVKLREQILDLIIYMLITLASTDQEGRLGSSTLLHAALVACSLYLLPAFVATEWLDVVPVLLAHPKVNMFMDAAFDAVRRDVGLLQSKLHALNSKLMSKKMTSSAAECVAQVIGQQCEASVQVLQSLCQPHAFRDKLLNHKELCKDGGLLRLALAVLKLQLPYSFRQSKYLIALISRLQSKILSMLVKFCETEPVSFLDEVAAEARTMHLAELVAGEVLALVRNALREDPRKTQGSTENLTPTGLLYIHAMQLADIFSDDSNFRNLVMDYITSDLTNVFSQAPTIFSSGWCGSPVGVLDASKSWSDAVLVYDPFRAAGAAMQSFKGSSIFTARPVGSCAPLADEYSGCSLSSEQIRPASYVQERASLFVKILANLHCFNPDICSADEKDRFLNLFLESLTNGAFNPTDKSFFLSTVQTAVRICENLFLLLDYVSSLPPEVVSDEDIQLVSTFYDALHDAICPGTVEPSFQEDPVVAYVRDAHEQKRRAMLAQRLQSERWQRIRQFSEASDKEQSTSISKTVTKPASSQSNVEDDTCQISEEAQSNGNRPSSKRKRKLQDLGDEIEEVQTTKEVDEQTERKEKELEWLDGEEMESRRLTGSVIRMETWGGETGKEVQKTTPMVSAVKMETWGQESMREVQSIYCSGEEGTKSTPTVDIVQNDHAITGTSKFVGNETVDMKVENINDKTFDDTEDRNDTASDIPFYEAKQDRTIGEKSEGFEIHGITRDIDYHEHTHNSLGEINLKSGIKNESLIDETNLKKDTDMGQESSHSMIGNTREGSAESEFHANDIDAMQKGTITKALCEEMQPKKRKRNIMNEKQMIAIENALKNEPDMQRYPKLIQQWATQLNKIGPELSYQQLKNWLNNRKARLARQAREAQGLEGDTRVCVFESDSTSPMDSAPQRKSVPRHGSNYGESEQKGTIIEDKQMRESGGFKRTSKPGKIIGGFQSKHVDDDVEINPMELDAYDNHGGEVPDISKASSRVSASVKFVKCEVGQYVSLLDTEGKEVAHGLVNQVDGKWEGKQLDEQGLCIVKISKLKVDKSMKLPHASPQSGSTFEESEALFGYMLVAWDTSRIFLIS